MFKEGKISSKMLTYSMLLYVVQIVGVLSSMNKTRVQRDTLEVNIPGTPGQDYTTFHAVPSTTFTCSSQQYPGYYADTEVGCQVFHVCQQDGKQDSFLCPNGTILNQQYFVCDWWYNFNCASAPQFYSLNSLLNKKVDSDLHDGLEQILDPSFLRSATPRTLTLPPGAQATSSSDATVALSNDISVQTQEKSVVLSETVARTPMTMSDVDAEELRKKTAATYRVEQSNALVAHSTTQQPFITSSRPHRRRPLVSITSPSSPNPSNRFKDTGGSAYILELNEENNDGFTSVTIGHSPPAAPSTISLSTSPPLSVPPENSIDEHTSSVNIPQVTTPAEAPLLGYDGEIPELPVSDATAIPVLFPSSTLPPTISPAHQHTLSVPPSVPQAPSTPIPEIPSTPQQQDEGALGYEINVAHPSPSVAQPDVLNIDVRANLPPPQQLQNIGVEPKPDAPLSPAAPHEQHSVLATTKHPPPFVIRQQSESTTPQNIQSQRFSQPDVHSLSLQHNILHTPEHISFNDENDNHNVQQQQHKEEPKLQNIELKQHNFVNTELSHLNSHQPVQTGKDTLNRQQQPGTGTPPIPFKTGKDNVTPRPAAPAFNMPTHMPGQQLQQQQTPFHEHSNFFQQNTQQQSNFDQNRFSLNHNVPNGHINEPNNFINNQNHQFHLSEQFQKQHWQHQQEQHEQWQHQNALFHEQHQRLQQHQQLQQQKHNQHNGQNGQHHNEELKSNIREHQQHQHESNNQQQTEQHHIQQQKQHQQLHNNQQQLTFDNEQIQFHHHHQQQQQNHFNNNNQQQQNNFINQQQHQFNNQQQQHQFSNQQNHQFNNQQNHQFNNHQQHQFNNQHHQFNHQQQHHQQQTNHHGQQKNQILPSSNAVNQRPESPRQPASNVLNFPQPLPPLTSSSPFQEHGINNNNQEISRQKFQNLKVTPTTDKFVPKLQDHVKDISFNTVVNGQKLMFSSQDQRLPLRHVEPTNGNFLQLQNHNVPPQSISVHSSTERPQITLRPTNSAPPQTDFPKQFFLKSKPLTFSNEQEFSVTSTLTSTGNVGHPVTSSLPHQRVTTPSPMKQLKFIMKLASQIPQQPVITENVDSNHNRGNIKESASPSPPPSRSHASDIQRRPQQLQQSHGQRENFEILRIPINQEHHHEGPKPEKLILSTDRPQRQLDMVSRPQSQQSNFKAPAMPIPSSSSKPIMLSTSQPQGNHNVIRAHWQTIDMSSPRPEVNFISTTAASHTREKDNIRPPISLAPQGQSAPPKMHFSPSLFLPPPEKDFLKISHPVTLEPIHHSTSLPLVSSPHPSITGSSTPPEDKPLVQVPPVNQLFQSTIPPPPVIVQNFHGPVLEPDRPVDNFIQHRPNQLQHNGGSLQGFPLQRPSEVMKQQLEHQQHMTLKQPEHPPPESQPHFNRPHIFNQQPVGNSIISNENNGAGNFQQNSSPMPNHEKQNFHHTQVPPSPSQEKPSNFVQQHHHQQNSHGPPPHQQHTSQQNPQEPPHHHIFQMPPIFIPSSVQILSSQKNFNRPSEHHEVKPGSASSNNPTIPNPSTFVFIPSTTPSPILNNHISPNFGPNGNINLNNAAFQHQSQPMFFPVMEQKPNFDHIINHQPQHQSISAMSIQNNHGFNNFQANFVNKDVHNRNINNNNNNHNNQVFNGNHHNHQQGNGGHEFHHNQQHMQQRPNEESPRRPQHMQHRPNQESPRRPQHMQHRPNQESPRRPEHMQHRPSQESPRRPQHMPFNDHDNDDDTFHSERPRLHHVPFRNFVSDDFGHNEERLVAYIGSDEYGSHENSNYAPVQKDVAVLKYK